jgi:hypothetical protein
LALLVVMGFLNIGIPGLLSVNEPTEIGLHIVTGALALYAGFSASYGSFAVSYAKWGGLFYALLGVVGFFMHELPLGIHLDLGCNVAHLLLGVWGAYVGFTAPAGKK